MKKMNLLALVISAAALMSSCGSGEQKEAATEATTEQVAINTTHAYVCPMNCENSASMEAGMCKVCGMELVKNPNYQGATADSTAAETTTTDTTQAEAGHEGHNH
jgi:hypothetical protein